MINPEIIAIAGTLIAVIVPGMGSGYAMQRIGELSESLLKRKAGGFFTDSLVFSVLAETPTIYGLLVAVIILTTIPNGITEVQAMALLLAAVDVAITGVLAAYSIGLVAQAALVGIKENSKLFGKTLILAALPEAIAIYGLIISLLILMAAGAFGDPKISDYSDIESLAIASVIISLSGFVALFIARIAVSAIKNMVTEDAVFGQTLVIAVLPESIALYALLVAVMILSGGGYI